MKAIAAMVCAIAAAATLSADAQRGPGPGRPTVRGPILDAHNCYPEDGQWNDRLQRALGTAYLQIGIEQDLVWKPGPNGTGVSVVAHDTKLIGGEPTLEEYFFKAVAPTVEAALKEGRKETWPLIVLHFDFKTQRVEHHRFVLQLLKRYERWLTSSPRTRDDAVQPMTIGPVLVLTRR